MNGLSGKVRQQGLTKTHDKGPSIFYPKVPSYKTFLQSLFSMDVYARNCERFFARSKIFLLGPTKIQRKGTQTEDALIDALKMQCDVFKENGSFHQKRKFAQIQQTT